MGNHSVKHHCSIVTLLKEILMRNSFECLMPVPLSRWRSSIWQRCLHSEPGSCKTALQASQHEKAHTTQRRMTLTHLVPTAAQVMPRDKEAKSTWRRKSCRQSDWPGNTTRETWSCMTWTKIQRLSRSSIFSGSRISSNCTRRCSTSMRAARQRNLGLSRRHLRPCWIRKHPCLWRRFISFWLISKSRRQNS